MDNSTMLQNSTLLKNSTNMNDEAPAPVLTIICKLIMQNLLYNLIVWLVRYKIHKNNEIYF